MAQNGWNKVEQGWNTVWANRMDHYDPFIAQLNLKFGPQEVPNWVQMAQKCNFRRNEGPSVDPGAVNEVVKSFNMVPLVRPDVYP